MHFEGEFKVPGKPADVIRRFADVPRMSGCMPGAVLEPQLEDGSWPGGMVVSFGPKKIAFKGKATCNFDLENHTGTVVGRGNADLRAARIGVKVGFSLHDDPAAATPTTIVKIVSDAELGGVLADFARAGGTAVANVIMADFARRCADEFAKDEVPEPVAPEPEPVVETVASAEPAPAVASPPPPPPQPIRPAPMPAPVPLSATSLLWAVIKSQFVRLGQWLGLVGRR